MLAAKAGSASSRLFLFSLLYLDAPSTLLLKYLIWVEQMIGRRSWLLGVIGLIPFFFWRSLHSFVFFSRRNGDESIVKDFSLESVHSHTATQQGHQERARGGYTHLKQPVSATPGILSTTKVGEFEVVGPYTSPQTAACIGMGDWSLLRVLRLSRSPPIAKGKADD